MVCCGGDWPAARDFTERGLEVEPQAQTLLSTRAVLEYQTGAFDQGKIYLGRLMERVHLDPSEPSLFASVAIPLVARDLSDELVITPP